MKEQEKKNSGSTLTLVLTPGEKIILDQIKEDLGEKTATKALKMLLNKYSLFIETNRKYLQLQKNLLKERELTQVREREHQTELTVMKSKIDNFILSFEELKKINF